MDKIDLYDINFEGCSTHMNSWIDKSVTLKTACVPLGQNGTKSECVSYLKLVNDCYAVNKLDKACDTFSKFYTDCNKPASIFAEERALNDIQSQCYIECSPTLHPSGSEIPANTTQTLDNLPTDFPSSTVKTYPTFVITFAAMLFALVLSSKRSH